MATDYYLKIDTIDGESTKKGVEKYLEIQSFSFGESQTGSGSAGTGVGTGAVSMQDFSFNTMVSKASPKLFLACAQGQEIKSAELVARKSGAGGKQEIFMKWKFSNLLVSSYQISGSGDSPSESFSLNFSKIEVEYKPQDGDKMGAAITAGYDLKAGEKV